MKIKSKFIMNILLLSIFLLLIILIIILRFIFIVELKNDEETIYKINQKIIVLNGASIINREFYDNLNEVELNYNKLITRLKFKEIDDTIKSKISLIKDATLKKENSIIDNSISKEINNLISQMLELSKYNNLNMKYASDLLNIVFFLSLFVLTVSIINFAFIGRTILLSIKKLISGIDMISDGILTSKIIIKSDDEYKYLADKVNMMASKLGDSYNILQEEINIRIEKENNLVSSENRYRSFFEENNAVMLIIDSENGAILDANPAAAKYYGYSKEELLSKKIYDLNIYHIKEDVEKMSALLSPEENHFYFKHKLSNGNLRDVEIFRTPIEVNGSLVFLSIVFDITEKNQLERNLRKSEANYRLLFNNVNDSIFVYHLDDNFIPHNFINVNDVACMKLGYSKKEFLEINVTDLIGEDNKDLVLKRIHGLPEEKKQNFEAYQKTKMGELIPVEISSNLIVIDGKNTVMTIAHDITDRKIREELLIKSRDEYLKILNDFPNPVWRSDENMNFDYFNGAWLNFTGKSIKTQMNHGWMDGIHHDDRNLFDEVLKDSFINRKSFSIEFRLMNNDGTYHWVSEFGMPFYNMDGKFTGLIGSCYDNNYIKITNEKINESLKEKDLLIKEIHHRVKNNLQIILSLLNLQLLKIDSKEIQDIIKVNHDRIKSMAMIHESLYQSTNFSKIDFENYIKYLCIYLTQNYHINSDKIKININVDNIYLKIDTSIPLGLIINELVSNSLKHSFADGREGEINLKIEKINDKRMLLFIRDNGIEFPKEFNLNNIKSFGYLLVNNLTYQLNGKIEINKIKNGMNEIKIEFDED
jgi:PAS domain S-box-containing protein